MTSNWVKALSLADLERKRTAVCRAQGKQIALFELGGEVLACNNRCPHEGYPLVEGSLDEGSVLTCNWHNWKFDLRDGRNLYGGDCLRTYPVEVRAGEVWVDIADPPLAERERRILASLRDAFDDNDYERIARELGRWQLIGADPTETIAHAIRWSYERMEFGWTHAYAGAADWLRLYDEHAGDAETQLACVLETVGHIADDVLRERSYPFAEGRLAFDEAAFIAAVDAEDEPSAARLVRGALADGLEPAALEAALTRAALFHYNDFGHSLIYVSKVGALIARLGAEVAEPLLLSLVRGLVYARREDKIPEFRGYAAALDAWTRGGASHERVTGRDFRRLGIAKALSLTTRCDRRDPGATFEALLEANALNMLSFDLSYQEHVSKPVSDNVGWLDFTHGITFANAVRTQCEKTPDAWPAGLLQLACFAGRNASYTTRDDAVDGWGVGDVDAFFERCIEGLFDHAKEEYIVSVHLLKTVLAARAEARAARAPQCRAALAAAVNRFLHEPLKRKHVRRTVRQAMSFVAKDG